MTLKRYSGRCEPSFRRRNSLLTPAIGCARLSPPWGPIRLSTGEQDVLKFVEAPLKKLKSEPPEVRLAFVFEALNEIVRSASIHFKLMLKSVVAAVLRSGLTLSAVETVKLVELVSKPRLPFPFKAVLSAIDGAPRTPALLTALHQLRGCVTNYHGSAEMKEIHERIDVLIGGPKEELLAPAGAWSQIAFGEVAASEKEFEWRALLLHARSLTQSTASKKWQTEAVNVTARIGQAEVLDAARRWLALGPTPGQTTIQAPEAEAAYQKGFVWVLGALGDASIAPDIADFAFGCFRKIPMIGAVSHRVGNACVNALAAMPGLDGVAQLSRLAARVKYDVARRLIEKAMNDAAERNQVSRDDLEAMAVPTFGLDAAGVRMERAWGLRGQPHAWPRRGVAHLDPRGQNAKEHSCRCQRRTRGSPQGTEPPRERTRRPNRGPAVPAGAPVDLRRHMLHRAVEAVVSRPSAGLAFRDPSHLGV